MIGHGEAEFGNFEDIEWGKSKHFITVNLEGEELDTYSLESVPYSKIATDMLLQDLKDIRVVNPDTGQVLKWNGVEWTNGSDDGRRSWGSQLSTGPRNQHKFQYHLQHRSRSGGHT